MNHETRAEPAEGLACDKLDHVPKARAPGRVTVIGDHTDYNAGLSLPIAVDLTTEVTFAPKPGSFLMGIESDQFPDEPLEIALDAVGTVAWGQVAAHSHLASALLRVQRPPGGGAVQVTSTLPVGAGLSSSAAFSVALLLVLGHSDDPLALAYTCQEAERLAGSPVGLLDPLAIAGAQKDHALHIDFHTLETEQVKIPDDAAFVIVHSESPRLLADSPYATRRAECERAAQVLGRPLGLCTLGDLSELTDPVLRRRARHVVTECARVREAEKVLARGNLGALGEIMNEGHHSLAHDYRVSIPAVDELVEDLQAQPGVLGARMTGGGFGGCVIALCERDAPALDPMAHSPRRAWRISPAGRAELLAT